MAGCIIILFYNKFPEQGTPPPLVPFFPFCELFRQEPAPAVFITISLSPGPKSSIKIVGFSLSSSVVGNHFILSEKPPQSNNMYLGKRPFLFSRHQADRPHASLHGNGKRPWKSARKNPPGKFRETGADFHRSIPLRFEGPTALPEFRRTNADSIETSSTCLENLPNSRIPGHRPRFHRNISRRLESTGAFGSGGLFTISPFLSKSESINFYIFAKYLTTLLTV